jgi:two-component system alkaline phosphatase synthesis response regulator PhoP
MSNGRILIVDDSENIRNVLEANFEYLGYEVLTAHDGAGALDLIRKEKPDLVILDVMMPRQNGFQVCRKIKTDPELSAVPVIFLSAKGQREDRFWGKDCGADEYVTKPFSAAELERVIERLMTQRHGAVSLEKFQSEVEAHRAAGDSFAVLTVTFDPKALNVFRQKYGEPRFHEGVDAIQETIELIVREEAGVSLVWATGRRSLQAILPGEQDRATALRDRIVVQSNLLLKSFYDALDAGRGYVVTRHPTDSREVHVPLLTVDASLAIESTRKAP